MRKSLAGFAVLLVSLLAWRACTESKDREALQRPAIEASVEERKEFAQLSNAEVEKAVVVSEKRIAIQPEVTERASSSIAAATPSLHGQVRDDSGTVVPGCRVVLRNGGYERSQVAGILGDFSFTKMVPGKAKLHVASSATLTCFPTPNATHCALDEEPWYGATCLDFQATNEDPVVLVLRRAAFLEGRVIDVFGTPMPGAIAEFKNRKVELLRLTAEIELTGDDGRFSARVFPGSTLLRTFTSPGSALQGSGRPPEKEYVLSPGETLDVGDLVIGGGGVKMTGRVVDQEGYGAEHVPVRARLVGANEWMTVETGGAGVFSFEGVYPGRYQIEVAPAGALPNSPARFLKKPRAPHEVEVTGEGGSHAIGNFQLDFDDSFHFYGRLVFDSESAARKEDLRVFAIPTGPGAPPTEPVYFTGPDEFAWHVRDPSLYSEVTIEVREIDPETLRVRQVYFHVCRPVAQGRERVVFQVL